ncbi:MAG TPA: peptide deformylase [Anaerolineales bacterium]|nr:peptide deformylase [Anaerolineales bacterium]
MGLREIVTLPAPILRRKARPVTAFNPDLQKLIDDMIETMRAAPGVGLAAPQVGIPERLIVVEYAEPPEIDETEPPAETSTPLPEVKPKLYVVANPVIMKASTEMVLGVEGCLSIPGLVGEVERYEAIQVNGLNRRGQPVKIKAEGWLARIFQHEIDHVNGIVFPDRAARVWKPEPDEVEDRV